MLALTWAFSAAGPGLLADDSRSPARFFIDDHQALPIESAMVDQPTASLPPAATSGGQASQRQPSRPFTARWSDVNQRQVVRQPEDWRLRWRETDVSHRRAVIQATANKVAASDVAADATANAASPVTREQRAMTGFSDRDPSRSESHVRSVRFNEPRPFDQHQTRRPLNPVRFASQEIPVDPFSDPFGDRALPMPAERTGNQPALREPAQSPPMPARDGFTPQPAPTEAASPQDPAFDDPAPRPMPSETTPFNYDPAPGPPGSANGADQYGDRVKRRNCYADGKECEEHRQRVHQSPLTAISLDITPRMTITKLDQTNYDVERQNTMRRVPPRVWRNVAGQTVADGRLVNFRHGRIEVETEDGLKKIPFAELSDDDMCFVTAWWSIPSECSLGNDQLEERNWVASTMTFKASSLCHKPLYFEDVNLERYGHTAGPFVQPVLSGAHFFMNVAALPYKMGINPPTECRYPLGYYRPGDCAPWLVRPIPLSIRGGLTAAATYVGGTFVIP